MPDAEKQAAELKPFSLTGDSFPKIIIRNDIGKSWYDDNGILNINLIDFLLDDSVIWAVENSSCGENSLENNPFSEKMALPEISSEKV